MNTKTPFDFLNKFQKINLPFAPATEVDPKVQKVNFKSAVKLTHKFLNMKFDNGYTPDPKTDSEVFDYYFTNRAYIDELESDNKPEHVTPLKMAKFLAKNNIFGIKGKALYVYDENRGIFTHLASPNKFDKFDTFARISVPQKWSANRIYPMLDEIFRHLISFPERHDLTQRDRQHFYKLDVDKPHLVAFSNGVLNLNDGSLSKHSPKNGLSFGYNFPYINAASLDGTKFQGFIWHLADNNPMALDALRKLLGMAFSNVRNQKIALYLYGDKDNGKSVLQKFIYRVLGPEFAQCSSLSQIGSKFGLGNLDHTKVLLFSDVELSEWCSKAVANTKAIISQDPIITEGKYQQASTVQHQAFLVYFANALPAIKAAQDAGGALSRRLFAIKTGSSVPLEEQITNLDDLIFEERPYIISWCVNSLIGYTNSNLIPPRIIDLETIFNQQLDLNTLSGQLGTWISQHIEFTGDISNFAYTYELEKAFALWLKKTASQFAIENSRDFSMKLSAEFKKFSGQFIKKKGPDGSHQAYFKVKLRDLKQEDLENEI